MSYMSKIKFAIANELSRTKESDLRTVRDVRNFANRAIERVEPIVLTDDVINAFGIGWHTADAQDTMVRGARRRAGLKAALEELGFTVADR